MLLMGDYTVGELLKHDGEPAARGQEMTSGMCIRVELLYVD
jgi:hypothetical protein